jgi:hypothetical protein
MGGFDQDYIRRRVEVVESGCWEWQKSRDRLGYGQVSRVSTGESLAHRLAYKIFKGSVQGLVVRHSCDNPPCCNPDHLEAGTQAHNLQDARDKKRMLPKPPSKVTPEILEDIKVRLLNGEKQRDIAKLHNISEPHMTTLKYKLMSNT